MSGEFTNQLLHFPTLVGDTVGQFSIYGQVSDADPALRRVTGENWLEEAAKRSGMLLFQFQPEVTIQGTNSRVYGTYEFSIYDSPRLRFDSDGLRLSTADGRDLPSSARSLEVLSVLLGDPNKVLSPDDILNSVNERRGIQGRTTLAVTSSVRAAVMELRNALLEPFDDGKDPVEVIDTKRGNGYLLPATRVEFVATPVKNDTPHMLVGHRLNSSLGLIGVYGIGMSDITDAVSRFPGSRIQFSSFQELVQQELYDLQTFDGRLKMSTERREVTVDGEIIDGLTKQEFDLLQFFMRNPNNAHTRLTILQNAWTGYYSEEYTGDRTVDVHVRRVREKIGDNAAKIVTVRGHGYKFENNKEEHSTTTVEYEGGWLQDALDSLAE